MNHTNLSDALYRLNECNSFSEATRQIVEDMAQWGFSSVIFAAVPNSQQSFADTILFANRPMEWTNRYLAEKHYVEDPVVKHFLRIISLPKNVLDPFTWKSLARETRLTMNERDILDYAKTFQMNDGLVVPIRTRKHPLALCSFSSEKTIRDPAKIKAGQIYAHHSYAKLASLPQSATVQALSEREKQCLQWLIHGKTDDDIGQILGLSSNTVHKYIEQSKTKLSATTRAQAVAKALQYNYISF